MNYKVRILQGGLRVSPPLHPEDEDWSDVLLVDPKYGDVVTVANEYGAFLALYDELQISDSLKTGDTFSFTGQSEPFARVDGVNLVPTRPLKGYFKALKEV